MLAADPPGTGPVFVYKLTGSGFADIVFSLRAWPEIPYYVEGASFSTSTVPMTGTSAGRGTAMFMTKAYHGGIAIFDDDAQKFIVETAGFELFAGPLSAPEMMTGEFPMFDRYTEAEYHLSVTLRQVGETPAVPEPASWALMITGIGLTGCALRRRRAAALATG
nr:PEPxxWA-CTERM sorting domain-containing protein [Sandaracinobacter neustonicus]